MPLLVLLLASDSALTGNASDLEGWNTARKAATQDRSTTHSCTGADQNRPFQFVQPEYSRLTEHYPGIFSVQ
jgi:hypothetical protein